VNSIPSFIREEGRVRRIDVHNLVALCIHVALPLEWEPSKDRSKYIVVSAVPRNQVVVESESEMSIMEAVDELHYSTIHIRDDVVGRCQGRLQFSQLLLVADGLAKNATWRILGNISVGIHILEELKILDDSINHILMGSFTGPASPGLVHLVGVEEIRSGHIEAVIVKISSYKNR